MYRKLIQEHLSLTSSQTYNHKELDPARIEEDIKAVGKLVDPFRGCIHQSMETRRSFYELVHGYRSDNRSK